MLVGFGFEDGAASWSMVAECVRVELLFFFFGSSPFTPNLSSTPWPLMLLHFGSVPILLVSSADAAEEIMKKQDLKFANRPKPSMFGKLMYNYKDVAMAPYGEYWRQMKSTLVLHLLSNKRVQSFHYVREKETSLMIEKIKQCYDSSSSVNLSEVLAKLTNDAICRVALGKIYGEGEGGREFKELLEEFSRSN
nr:cytochrome p450 71a24 [Quercus suber]